MNASVNSAAATRVGLIGLGAMGAGMAASLRRAGFAPHVFDVRPGAAEAFAREGGTACASAAQLAAACDVVVCVVVNAAQTEDVLFGSGGVAAALKPGSVFVMCSTVDPNWAIALEARLEALGLWMLDAPISGGAAKAASGQMTMMTAGRAEAYARCGGALDAMAAKVYKLGDRAGAGSKVKIINQLLAGVHIAAAAEAMALGLREGVDPTALYEVITHSAGNSWMFENRMAHVLAADYTPLSAVDIFVKDLGLVLDMARASKFPLPLSSTAHQMFMQASTAGFAKEDDSAVIKIFPGITLAGEEGMTTLKLGCVADDFTGATDLANNLVRAGMRVVQTIGVPSGPIEGVDCVVVALKSRTAPVDQAVAQSVAAARWLRAQGAPQIYFKVCSTFDSTPQGNIGPVAQALLADAPAGPGEPDAGFALVTPAFPENGRTVFKGHLFVGDVLLSDSPMRHHPLTPMTDANLVRVMQAQLRGAQAGLIDHRVVGQGVAAVRARIEQLRAQGVAFGIADAVSDADLRTLAAATQHLAVVVAGSGLAIGIPALHGLQPSAQAAQLPAPRGTRAVVSGSCSAATNAQVADFVSRGGAAMAIDPLRLAAGEDLAAQALAWALPRLSPQAPVLVYATAEPEAVRAVQAQLGADRAGALVEAALARVAAGLVQAGVGQLLVAGGETSGACVQALGITQLRIGPQIDPGVPWCHAGLAAAAGGGLHLALKSGNFGGVDFFTRAFAQL